MPSPFGIFRFFRISHGFFRRNRPSGDNEGRSEKPHERQVVETNDTAPTDPEPSISESVGDAESEDIQMGVRQARAAAAAWSKQSLVAAYIGIFLVFFICSLQQQIATNLTPYVTSSFSKHALLSITQVMSSIIGAVAKLPVAKIIDIWGRAEGYILMVVTCTLGLIMMALCNSVEMYAAAQVFYWIGYNGMIYVLDVFLADTSSLKNRGWLFAFSTSPYAATAWAGPAAAEKFQQTVGWRWGFGTFCVVIPAVSTPVVAIFIHSRRKAEELGYLGKQKSGRTWRQSNMHYFEHFDVVGMILLVAAFALVLLSISFAAYQTLQWKSAAVISMLIIGGCCLVCFVVWERYFAKVCFAPFHLLSDKMVLGACFCSAIMFASFYCWDMYFSSYLQVVYGQSIKHAGYISNIYSIVGCIWAVVVGGIIRATGRFKYIALGFIPVQILGVGLMIHYRQPGSSIGSVIMCQVIIALSGGTLMICEQIAIMAAASHSEIAVVLALLGLFTNLGAAIGQTISGAIWSQTIPQALVEYLPESTKTDAMEIFASLPKQLGYAMESPEREGIMEAYSVAMRRMLIVGVALLPLAALAIIAWRNLQLKNVKQVKGTVV